MTTKTLRPGDNILLKIPHEKVSTPLKCTIIWERVSEEPDADAGQPTCHKAGVKFTDLTTDTLTIERASGNTMGAMLVGYFLVLDSSTSTFYVSDLLHGTTWDPTQYAQRSTAPDRRVALIVPKSSREIWLLGEQTSEVWNNAGTFPFPFVPIPGALLAHGCAAPWSAKEILGGILWPSRSRSAERGPSPP